MKASKTHSPFGSDGTRLIPYARRVFEQLHKKLINES